MYAKSFLSWDSILASFTGKSHISTYSISISILLSLKWVGWGGRLFQFDWKQERVGAYSRLGAYYLFLPLGWALIRGGR